MNKVFFYKQKTAYELRISDWSSDVCSSDLQTGELRGIEALYLQPRLQHTSLAPAADESDVGRVGGECSAQCIGIALALRCHHDEALAGRLARKRQALDAPDRVGNGILVLRQRRDGHGIAAARGKIGDGAGHRRGAEDHHLGPRQRSEEHTSELQSLMRNSYAV